MKINENLLLAYYELNRSYGKGRFAWVWESLSFIAMVLALSVVWSRVLDNSYMHQVYRLCITLSVWRATLYVILRSVNEFLASSSQYKSEKFSEEKLITAIGYSGFLRFFICIIWLVPLWLLDNVMGFGAPAVKPEGFIVVLLMCISLVNAIPFLVFVSAVYTGVRAFINSVAPMMMLITPVIWSAHEFGNWEVLIINPVAVLIMGFEWFINGFAIENQYLIIIAATTWFLISLVIKLYCRRKYFVNMALKELV